MIFQFCHFKVQRAVAKIKVVAPFRLSGAALSFVIIGLVPMIHNATGRKWTLGTSANMTERGARVTPTYQYISPLSLRERVRVRG